MVIDRLFYLPFFIYLHLYSNIFKSITITKYDTENSAGDAVLSFMYWTKKGKGVSTMRGNSLKKNQQEESRTKSELRQYNNGADQPQPQRKQNTSNVSVS